MHCHHLGVSYVTGPVERCPSLSILSLPAPAACLSALSGPAGARLASPLLASCCSPSPVSVWPLQECPTPREAGVQRLVMAVPERAQQMRDTRAGRTHQGGSGSKITLSLSCGQAACRALGGQGIQTLRVIVSRVLASSFFQINHLTILGYKLQTLCFQGPSCRSAVHLPASSIQRKNSLESRKLQPLPLVHRTGVGVSLRISK